jgi:hypothetical protein
MLLRGERNARICNVSNNPGCSIFRTWGEYNGKNKRKTENNAGVMGVLQSKRGFFILIRIDFDMGMPYNMDKPADGYQTGKIVSDKPDTALIFPIHSHPMNNAVSMDVLFTLFCLKQRVANPEAAIHGSPHYP